MGGCLGLHRALAFAACLSGLCLLWAATQLRAQPLDAQQGPASAEATRPIKFDIPAQPLADALRQYALLTQQPALFRSELVADRVSSAVNGLYSPEDALRRLLEGTGLVAETADSSAGKAFVLQKAKSAPASLGPWGVGDYKSVVQIGVWEALCNSPRTAPGSYRLLLRFKVDAEGWLRAVQLLDSSGDTQRDGAVLAALQRVRLDAPPPADLPQPVTMLILPRDPHGRKAGPQCGTDGRAY